MDRARLPFSVFAVPIDVNLVPSQRDASRGSGAHGVLPVIIERRGRNLLERIVLVGRKQNGNELAIQRLAVHSGLAGNLRPSLATTDARDQGAKAQNTYERCAIVQR